MQQVTDSVLIKEAMEQVEFQSNFSFDVTPYVRLFQFEPGDHILAEGSVSSYLLYMFKGRAKLYMSHSNGRVTLIEFLNSPAYIGEMELMGVMTETIGVRAITRCNCLALPVSECKQLLQKDLSFYKSLCVFLGEKNLIQTTAFTKNQAFPLENRLAAFLLISSHGGVYREKHTEAADYLGVSYRHLLFVLARFVSDGLLQKTPGGYHIADRAGLQALAEGMK